MRPPLPVVRRLLVSAIAGASLLAGPGALLADGMRAPTVGSSPRPPLIERARRPVVNPHHGQTVATGFFMGLLGFYRTVVSAVDGDRCSMAPTCSVYSHRALREHGIWLGILLTADRLIHEADSPSRAPRIRIGGESYTLDSLEDNTYWLGE